MEKFDLSGWWFVLRYADSLDIYAKGSKRVAIYRNTGRVCIRYEVGDAATDALDKTMKRLPPQ